MSDLPEFDRIVLAPDEFLLLSPKHDDEMTAEQVDRIIGAIPDGLRGRVLVFDGLKVSVVKP